MSSDVTQELKRNPQDEQLWTQWYTSFYPRIYPTAFRLAEGNPDIARDLTQETFVRFLEASALDKVVDDDKATAYLLVICRNAAITRLRRERTTQIDRLINLEDLPQRERSDPAIELDRLAEKLDSDDRLLFDAARAGLGLGEIAAKLSLSYTAAGVRLHRLIQRLRKSLRKR